MNICYVINNNKKFIDILKVSVASVLEYNTGWIRFYILYDGLDEKDKISIKSVVKSMNSEIYFIDISAYTNIIHLDTGWPNIVNVRLFLKKFLPNHIKKILYLDSDTLIVGPLDELYDIDMRNKAVAVVADTIKDTFKEKIGLKKDDVYFNSGVMLINVERYSQLLNETSINKIIKKYGKNIKYPDQDLLNCCFVKKNEYILLPLKYNVLPPYFMFKYKGLIEYKNSMCWQYSQDEYKSSVHSPSIVHFAGSFCYSRPWANNCQHPYANKFREISYRINCNSFDCQDDRDVRQKVQSFVFKWIPNDIIIPLISGVRRLYEKGCKSKK